MTTKASLHVLIDQLPETMLPEAERYLRRLQAAESDSFLQFLLNAPEDDEPLTAEDIAAIEEGKAEIARGDVLPWEVFLEQLRSKE